MTSMPEQTPVPGVPQATAVVPLSGIWEIGQVSASDADLAVVVAMAYHRGLLPLPQRKSVPIPVST